jgi:hypothetical protein
MRISDPTRVGRGMGFIFGVVMLTFSDPTRVGRATWHLLAWSWIRHLCLPEQIPRHARVASAPGHQTPRVWGGAHGVCLAPSVFVFRPHACGEGGGVAIRGRYVVAAEIRWVNFRPHACGEGNQGFKDFGKVPLSDPTRVGRGTDVSTVTVYLKLSDPTRVGRGAKLVPKLCTSYNRLWCGHNKLFDLI